MAVLAYLEPFRHGGATSRPWPWLPLRHATTRTHWCYTNLKRAFALHGMLSLVLCCLVRLQNHELVLHIRPRTRLRSSVSDRTLQSTSIDWSVTYSAAAADTNVSGCEQQTAARSSWLLWKEHFVIRACDGTPGITLRVRLRPSVQNIGWYCVYWSCGQNLALYCKRLHYYFI